MCKYLTPNNDYSMYLNWQIASNTAGLNSVNLALNLVSSVNQLSDNTSYMDRSISVYKRQLIFLPVTLIPYQVGGVFFALLVL